MPERAGSRPRQEAAVEHASHLKAAAEPVRQRVASAPDAMNPLWRDVAWHVPARAQFKLAISSPDDPSEREADRMADQVMRTPQYAVQRKCHACSGDEEESVQRKSDNTTTTSGGSGLARSANSTPSSSAGFVRPADDAGSGVEGDLRSGVPLAPGTRSFFESRFGQNFGDVRVHADSQADAAARSVDALAFTVGRNVAFRAGQYSPDTHTGRRLLAHELTHVVQQRGSGHKIQRAPACPARPSGEVAQSRTPAGILPANVVFTPAAPTAISQLDVRDFAVNSANLPPATTSDIEWQRALSIIAGDPTIRVQVAGYTDCAGSESENVSLRKERMDTVLTAMSRVGKKVVITFAIPTTTFVDTNDTPEGRARNRSVRITFTSWAPKGKDPCDMLTKAKNIDEYVFLVHCLESKLGLTKPADAPKALSALRQIYFGSGDWSAKQQSVWDSVIEDPVWDPGDDPTPKLGGALAGALKASDEVAGVDISHVLTGLDAMMSPHDVEHLPGLINATTVPNEEWATWSGDVGSAAAEWVVAMVYAPPGTPPPSQKDLFESFAGDDDLRGNIDAFAIRAGFNPGGTPSSRLKQTLRLTGTLSEDLRQYYRLTSSALGARRASATKEFVEAYGGVLSGSTVTNRAVLARRMRDSVAQFAGLYMVFKLLKRGYLGGTPPPAGAPQPMTLIDPAIDAMIDRFITWLETHP